MATLMGPTYANLFAGFIEHQFFSQYNGPKPEYCGTFTRDELTQLITIINSSRLALKYTWEISDTCLAFLDIKFQLKATIYALVFPTNLQTHIVTCCMHFRIHYTPRISFFSQFLKHLYSGDSDFSDKSEAMCQFLLKRGFETEKDWDEGIPPLLFATSEAI